MPIFEPRALLPVPVGQKGVAYWLRCPVDLYMRDTSLKFSEKVRNGRVFNEPTKKGVTGLSPVL